MIYSMGLLLAGMGMALAGVNEIDETDEPGKLGETAEPGGEADGTDGIKSMENEAQAEDSAAQKDSLRQEAIKNAAGLASEDAERMLARARSNPDTNGAAVLRDYGALGATGHAASGFPGAVFTTERLEYYIKKENLPGGEAGALALCDSMASLEDTNLLHRGGAEGLEFTKEKASGISKLPVPERIPALTELDNEMIDRNLSPGGSADMLALAFLLGSWDER
jgi:triphosphoribosyl-dephospho-CoA synthetase